MSIDREVREQISLYLRGQLEAEELEAWLIEVTWDIDNEPSSVRRVAFGALRLLSEAGNGDWTDEDLRKKLTALLLTVSTSVPNSWKGEGFLEKLDAAEEEARREHAVADPSESLMRYAINAKAASCENWRSNDPGSLGQSKGESDTRPPAQVESAIG